MYATKQLRFVFHLMYMKMCCVTGNVGFIPYFIRFCNVVDTTRRCNRTCIMCVRVYIYIMCTCVDIILTMF